MPILSCRACGARNRVPELMPTGAPRCGRCKASLSAQVRVMSTVDIGAIRYFDGRDLPLSAWMGPEAFDAALASEPERERPNAYVWVLPAELAPFLDEIGDQAAVVWFGRFRGALLGPRLDGLVLACVDRDGWRPSSIAKAAASAHGVQIALELPVLVEPGTTRTTRALLDQARARRS